MNRVCVLTPAQALALESRALVPCCREHRHISRAQADDLVENNYLVYRDDRGDFVRSIEVRWVGKGKKYLAFVRSRLWKRVESASTTVMQLVPGGGAW
jgi:hypothetical protein